MWSRPKLSSVSAGENLYAKASLHVKFTGYLDELYMLVVFDVSKARSNDSVPVK